MIVVLGVYKWKMSEVLDVSIAEECVILKKSMCSSTICQQNME
jgi:hypothetical protein